jgi:hypothetical protein
MELKLGDFGVVVLCVDQLAGVVGHIILHCPADYQLILFDSVLRVVPSTTGDRLVLLEPDNEVLQKYSDILRTFMYYFLFETVPLYYFNYFFRDDET